MRSELAARVGRSGRERERRREWESEREKGVIEGQREEERASDIGLDGGWEREKRQRDIERGGWVMNGASESRMENERARARGR